MTEPARILADSHADASHPATTCGRVYPPVRGALPRRPAVWLAAAALVAGCGVEDPGAVGRLEQAVTVDSYVYSVCSTSVVMGLSIQIADEIDCMSPGLFDRFEEGAGIEFSGSAVLPYITSEAKADLLAAVAAHGGTLEITSAYRTLIQQYLLRRWYEVGRCGITAAATPGNSNHESGRALDVGNYSTWLSALESHGWDNSVPGDPVHFDHLASPDLRGMDVHAFQRLWNRNHPEDLIDEDGIYGPQTAARIAAAPADGFAQGACSAGLELDAELVASDIPAGMAVGERQVAWIELRNTGTRSWTVANTRLGTTGPRDRDSGFYDAENWLSPSRPTPVDADTAPGEIGRFTFMVAAPDAPDTVVTETFGLVEEGVAWFGPEDLTVSIAIDAAGGTPDDPGDPDDPPEAGGEPLGGYGQDPGAEPGVRPDLVGGCSAAGGAGGGGALWILCAGLALSRRRRSRPRPRR